MSFSRSKSNQSVDNSTTVTTTNQQVGASEDGIAIGAGASNITVERLDDDVLQSATDAIVSSSQTVGRSLDTVDNVINNNLETTKAAFEFSASTNRDALSEVGDTVEQANALLAQSFEQSSNILARNAGVEGTDDVKTGNNALLIAGGVAALLILTTLGRKSK